jgi:hypothetical protein
MRMIPVATSRARSPFPVPCPYTPIGKEARDEGLQNQLALVPQKFNLFEPSTLFAVQTVSLR